MAKKFAIDIDFRVTKRIYVDAENEEQAEKLAKEKLDSNPYQYCTTPDSCTDFDICEVSECEDDTDADPLKPALDYVCEQLGTERTVAIRMQVTYNMKHRMPINMVIDDAHVIDLLEEYGQDNDLPEGWWMEYGEIDDILKSI